LLGRTTHECRQDHLELDDRRNYGAVMARDEGLPVDPEKIDVAGGERDRIVGARPPTSREHLGRSREAFANVGEKYGVI